MKPAVLILGMLAVISSALAFVPPSLSMVTTDAGCRRKSSVVTMACRFNAKREKRRRNGENARKYRLKSTGPKFLAGGTRTRKRDSKADYSRRLEQEETDYCAKLFKHQDVDALLSDTPETA